MAASNIKMACGLTKAEEQNDAGHSANVDEQPGRTTQRAAHRGDGGAEFGGKWEKKKMTRLSPRAVDVGYLHGWWCGR